MVSVMKAKQNVSVIFQKPQITIKAGEKHFVTLSKTLTIWKPKVFPLNCMYKTKEHKFPGFYKQMVCDYFNHKIKIY